MSLHRIPLLIALCAALPVGAQQAFPATLTGHAALPARSFVEAPKDAPDSLRTSGKYTAPHGRRVDQLESIAGTSYLSAKEAPRPTGISLPFAGQPVQGFSGIKSMGNGRYWVLTDNGFGAKSNSADAMLMFHEVEPDWKTGQVKRHQTVFLHDPDRKVPFLIVNEGTRERYLTGADFDPESIQFIGNEVWIGDELGPYLVKADREGKVLAVFETQVDGKLARSPDHYTVSTPAVPGAFATNVRRSRGYEGMAASKDGRFLYPLLEGPMWDEAAKQWEMKDGREYLRVLEFDVQKGAWTGRSWKYLLEANGNNIGDFNMIDADTGLIIERDNGEGTADKACPADQKRTDCFHDLAKFKRVYKIEMSDANVGGEIRKIGYIDLMNIQDPQRLARKPLTNGVLTFPFFTIENVDIVDATHIVVGNDNNLPFSSSREPNKADDNELVLLEVGALLRAR